jgi:predicted transcriptional regulator
MLEYLFANKNVEKILVYLHVHKKAHATELQKCFGTSLDPIQKTLKKLESGGLLESGLEGKARTFRWNQKYSFLAEMQSFAKKIYEALPEDARASYRRAGKRKRPSQQAEKPQKVMHRLKAFFKRIKR